MVIKVHDVFVVQCFVKLDFSVNLAEGKSSKKKTKKQKTKVRNCNSMQTGGNCAHRHRELRAYLLPLVRFGDARVWDDFGCINFAGGEVGHLVAFCKASLCE